MLLSKLKFIDFIAEGEDINDEDVVPRGEDITQGHVTEVEEEQTNEEEELGTFEEGKSNIFCVVFT